MAKKISIICPTHQRSTLQTRFTDRVFSNCNDINNCEIVFGIDKDDDEALTTANTLAEKYGPPQVKVYKINPGEKIPNISNLCFAGCSGDIIGNAADDVVFESKNWDVTVAEEFAKYPDGILLLWSDDGIWGGSLASHYFMHRNWIAAAGYIQPTYFHADWTDHWNQTLANRLGRGKLIRDRNRLFLRHLHAEFGGMEKDETYWKVKAKRERNVKEGLSFHNPTEEMKQAFESQYQRMKKFIEDFKHE